MIGLALVLLVLAGLPFGLVICNLALYRRPRAALSANGARPRVAVLIPARDEESSIARAVTSALASRGVDLEVVVMDDHSSDRTPAIVRDLAARDGRVRLERAPDLPPGWAGKPHACQALADTTTAPWLLFMDADVVLEPDAVSRVVGFLQDTGADLASGFPRQVTGTVTEKLLIPLVHLVLLGYLPIWLMRRSRDPAFAAGCGQLMMVRRDAYRRAGGHAVVRGTFHDGLQLPRAFRRAGLRTDLFDATRLASCRMYSSARTVLAGLAKNAHEGMAGAVAIWVWSGLLLGGHAAPFAAALVGALLAPRSAWLAITLVAAALSLATRIALALRFRHSGLGVALHPVGVTALVAIQWYARMLRLSGRRPTWKGRPQVQDASGLHPAVR